MPQIKDIDYVIMTIIDPYSPLCGQTRRECRDSAVSLFSGEAQLLEALQGYDTFFQVVAYDKNRKRLAFNIPE